MKKRSNAGRCAVILASALILAALSGCGSEKEKEAETSVPTLEEAVAEISGTEEGAEVETLYPEDDNVLLDENAATVYDINPSDYVTLGDYKNMDIEIGEPEIDEDLADYYTKSYYSSYATYVADTDLVTDRAVEDGDMVSIDYEGKKDGVAFDGGTAQNQALWIGSHSFIDGFEDGLIGVNPGETVDLNLTFPEDYGAEDLAGADVVFTVTVHGIIPESAIMAQVNNEFGEEYGSEMTAYADLRQMICNWLMEDAQAQIENSISEQIATGLLEILNVDNSLPEELVETYRRLSSATLNRVASMYGTDAETIASYYFGMTAADYIQNGSFEDLQVDLALRIIADENGLSLDGDALNARMDAYAAENGFENRETLLQNIAPAQCKVIFMQEDVLNWLKEYYKSK